MKDHTSASHVASSHNDVLDDILGMFRDRGDSMYAGEPVSQTQHALQAACLAETERAGSALIADALKWRV